MNNAKLMQLEIEKKRRLPDTVKNSISNNIFVSLLAAIIVLVYLVAINVVYKNFDSNTFELYLKYFALVISVITVIAFEIAYRKNSKKYALIGIELLICGCLSLYIPYIYLHTTDYLRNIIMILPAVLVVYYIIKAYIIYKANKIAYQSNLSDIKEIMKDKSEKSSYIDEESDKSYRAKIKEEDHIREVIKKEQVIRKKKKELISKKMNITQENNYVQKEAKKSVDKKIEESSNIRKDEPKKEDKLKIKVVETNIDPDDIIETGKVIIKRKNKRR